MYEKCFYSRVPNNRRGWNIRWGVDIVITFNNMRGWNNRGGEGAVDEVENIV